MAVILHRKWFLSEYYYIYSTQYNNVPIIYSN